MAKKGVAMKRVEHSNRTREAIDSNLLELRPLAVLTPSNGWIRTIREGLRMSQAQLAARLGVNQRSVHAMEISEAKGRIQLESLKRAAEALNCDLAYALIPRQPLQETINARATVLAKAQIAAVNQTMLLENQRPKMDETRLKELTKYILTHDVPLWESPVKGER